MATRSLDEVRADYISSMGPELGASFFQLYRKLVELHVLWQQYRQLFGSEEGTVQLLNRTAGLFFKIVQDELWDSVLLGISRMTDPPGMGKHRNLTIQSLPPLIGKQSLRTEMEILCERAVQAAEFAREHRNKRIAHQDHGYAHERSSSPLGGISRTLVEEMLTALRAVLNRLELHFRGNTVLYEKFVDESGARLLVLRLRELERLRAATERSP